MNPYNCPISALHTPRFAERPLRWIFRISILATSCVERDTATEHSIMLLLVVVCARSQLGACNREVSSMGVTYELESRGLYILSLVGYRV